MNHPTKISLKATLAEAEKMQALKKRLDAWRRRARQLAEVKGVPTWRLLIGPGGNMGANALDFRLDETGDGGVALLATLARYCEVEAAECAAAIATAGYDLDLED